MEISNVTSTQHNVTSTLHNVTSTSHDETLTSHDGSIFPGKGVSRYCHSLRYCQGTLLSHCRDWEEMRLTMVSVPVDDFPEKLSLSDRHNKNPIHTYQIATLQLWSRRSAMWHQHNIMWHRHCTMWHRHHMMRHWHRTMGVSSQEKVLVDK